MRLKGLTSILILAVITCISGCEKKANQVQGYIEGDYTYISAQTSGTLQTLAVHRGESIKQNQLLFQFNLEPQNYQLQQAQFQVAQAQSQLNDLLKGARSPEVDALIAKEQAAQASTVYAKKVLDQQKQLRAKGYNSVENLNLAEQNYQAALADLNAAKANIQNAHLPARTDQIVAASSSVQAFVAHSKEVEWQLNQKQQVAPFDAVVADTYFYPSENVAVDEPVISLIRPQDTYAIFYVSVKDRAALHLGETVSLKANETNRIVQGKINFLSTQAMYTPPLIYSEENMEDLVFEVHATLPSDHFIFWPGQPVEVSWPLQKS
jgi:HlyD family secretion protein